MMVKAYIVAIWMHSLGIQLTPELYPLVWAAPQNTNFSSLATTSHDFARSPVTSSFGGGQQEAGRQKYIKILTPIWLQYCSCKAIFRSKMTTADKPSQNLKWAYAENCQLWHHPIFTDYIPKMSSLSCRNAPKKSKNMSLSRNRTCSNVYPYTTRNFRIGIAYTLAIFFMQIKMYYSWTAHTFLLT